MVNKVQLIGRLGQNPEFRTTQDGAELARFTDGNRGTPAKFMLGM